MRFGFLALAVLAINAPAAAQSRAFAGDIRVDGALRITNEAGTRTQRALRLAGFVHDSLTGFPLPGAVVQLVEDDGSYGGRSVIADERGRFQFAEIAPGRYRVGFHHPLLDTLGIEAPVRALDMRSDVNDMLLAVPSSLHIRTTVCGAGTGGRDATLLMGTVFDARTGAAVPNASIQVEWTEIDLGTRSAIPRRARRVVTSGTNGWYGVCDVPREGVVQISARTRGDSTDQVEVRLAAQGLNQRVLYLGASSTTRVAGVVRRDGSKRPVANAMVSVPNGPATRANENGEFVLDEVSVGTRAVDVRAVGFYPEHLSVNAIDEAPKMEIGLHSFRSVLDTVKVLANYQRYSLRRELAERQRTGIGRFITEKDIARRKPIVLTDLLYTTPGVFVSRGLGLQQFVSMRGLFTSRCQPSLFLNGFAMYLNGFAGPPFSFGDLETMVRPDDVLAIEVYVAGQVPPSLGAGVSGCGTIAVWTR